MSLGGAALAATGINTADLIAGIPFWGDGSEEDADPAAPYSSHPWDIAVLGGLRLPGICDYKPTGVAGIEIDKKKTKGSHGAKITILGYDPRTFDITCEVWTAAQWKVVQDVVRHLWKGATATAADEANASISVYYPGLRLVGIGTAIIAGVTPPVKGSFESSRIIAFHMHERVTSKGSVTKSPTGSVTVVQPLRNSTPSNVAETSPGNDKNYTSLLPK